MTDLRRTCLYDLQRELGAKMVPFAGYEMPVQYPMGVMGEHLHSRAQAGLFDVSHMGQVILRAPAQALEALVPVDVQGLAEGRQRYAMFTNAAGGILDDLMIANRGDHLFLVVNAACKEADIAHLQAHLPGVEPVTDRALLALQGPLAETALARLIPGVAAMKFMDVAVLDWEGAALWISRSGYTGDDGYEISLPEDRAEAFARALLAMEEVAPIGLGARDSLRLEAGLCLYGHDIDTETSPVEAGLTWAIQKRRRTEGGFPGADRIQRELAEGPSRKRVGLLPEGRAPMRDGTALFDSETAEAPVGTITSGGFGPSLQAPIAMGYVPTALAEPGTRLWGEVRGKRLPVRVAKTPFRPSTYRT
ncbi:glycine cleavage system aminomethyltransferase GcvT [Pararhodobacter aggregans]|uniref:aminomethyltransferase n=1 Tax=Pararhodobacter aggregans TaxID=404875 RepID=A0A2T7UWH9_9RHOB|nr:glycine cleavage system aminomethyltransferase GcvT [Pararhodobacter aggregans]PTW99591.1 aminomethyltransferase [Pararhodobacter aggregans]PVE48918.1 glycine cleavage system aminomethyltransferase GcvT [Pararhodobacter aggregans]